MREKNATSIEYFKDPRRIVDLLNGMVFHGRQVITEDNLLEKIQRRIMSIGKRIKLSL